MAPVHASKSAKASKEEFDVISNRLALALAKRESIIKSWTASSSRPRPAEKTQAELEAEDAALFHNEPAHLGVGAPIPSHFLVSEAERNNKSLRAKFFPPKGLKASKARDAEEKAASMKRGLRDESSDEEEGRSGLGRAKKQKVRPTSTKQVMGTDGDEDGQANLAKAKLGNMANKALEPLREVRKIGIPGIDRDRKGNVGLQTSVKVPSDDGQVENKKAAQQTASISNGTDGRAEEDAGKIRNGGVVDSKEAKRIRKREKKKERKRLLKLKEAELPSMA